MKEEQMKSEINNYNIYLQRMNKSLKNKLFFLQSDIDWNNIDTIIDFGCADGTLLLALKEIFGSSKQYVGIDNNQIMRDSLNRRCQDVDVLETLQEAVIKYNTKRSLLIFSSVLHEVDYYLNRLDKDSFTEVLLDNEFAYIVVRDMYFQEQEELCNRAEYIKLYSAAMIGRRALFKDYMQSRGDRLSLSTVVEFFLKYDYLENWSRERDERYFYDYDKYDNIFLFNHFALSKEHYCLDYIRNKVHEDFNIDFNYKTHQNVIYKGRSNY